MENQGLKLLVILMFFLGCAPVVQEPTGADAGSNSPGISPDSERGLIQFSIGQNWIVLNSDLPVADAKGLQLVNDGANMLVADFQKEVNLWSADSVDAGWQKLDLVAANPLLRVFDTFIFGGVLHAVGIDNKGIAIYRITKDKTFGLVDVVEGKLMEDACVATNGERIHILGRLEGDAMISHYRWEFGKSFSAVEMTNVVPSSAGLDCAYFKGQLFLLYRNSSEDRRPASLWRSPLGANWSKVSHDVSTSLGYVTMFQNADSLIIAGQDAYMQSEDGSIWNYFTVQNSGLSHIIDSVNLENKVYVLGKPDEDGKPSLYVLSDSTIANTQMQKQPTWLRSDAKAFVDQIAFKGNHYFIKRDDGTYSIEVVNGNTTVVETNFAVSDTMRKQITADQSKAYLFSVDGVTRKLRESADMQSWSDLTLPGGLPDVSGTACIVRHQGSFAFIDKSGGQVQYFANDGGIWQQALFSVKNLEAIEWCHSINEQIFVLLRANNKFALLRIGPNGFEMDTAVSEFLADVTSPSEIVMVRDNLRFAIVLRDRLLISAVNNQHIIAATGIAQNYLSGFFAGDLLYLISPSFIPDHFALSAYKYK